ncbi:hypothetical protein P171DRAFT_447864 [Karstenula rhodostoma CBS 690.94]|uniref:Uncharacterized protein n=1 Tax=Karstenula rhodostoma CBS 690.94 TaxID=1392251 RepID=A0A9P4PB60_9PLEO|nr:hypothetical protein P171DRAFT_447864 [Karstenula rhodostoma CBS 690.94]
MADYGFASPLPSLRINPISCKYDKSHPYDNRVHNLDNTYAECFSERRWFRICGQEQDATATGDQPCASCQRVASSKNWIPSRLVEIQSAYAELLDSEQAIPSRFSAHTGGMRAWLEATVLRQQCKATFARMADVLRSVFPTCPGSPIQRIDELEFISRDWNHCVFLIFTEYGDFVFDPTGKQFGPSWPIVAKYEDYECRVQKVIWQEKAGTWKQRMESLLSN